MQAMLLLKVQVASTDEAVMFVTAYGSVVQWRPMTGRSALVNFSHLEPSIKCHITKVM